MLSTAARAEDLVLFDPTGTEPPRLVFLAFPATGAKSSFVTGGAQSKLDTTAKRAELAGLTSIPRLLPDLGEGTELEFELQLTGEAHGNSDDNRDGRADRAGFSVVLLDRELRGIELAFWPQRVWAQDDGRKKGPLFTQAEGVEAETGKLVRYTLKLGKDGYVLVGDGVRLLEGRLRDYSAFNGSPNPHRTKNYVFLGDNSSRSGSAALIGRVTLRTP